LLIAYSLGADGFETAPALRSRTVQITTFIRSNVHPGGWCRPAQRRGNTRADAGKIALPEPVTPMMTATRAACGWLLQDPIQLSQARRHNQHGYIDAKATINNWCSLPGP
jgi:hypothetical protein